MKKYISMILLFALLLSCCACGVTEETTPATDVTEATQATEPPLDPTSAEARFGHIDQTVLLDGYYKIWNPDGVIFMMENHPEGQFQLLCSIDMEGAVLNPITEFTGSIKGSNFSISNFALEGSGENFGFIAVNKGDISNLTLENITLRPSADAKNIGAIAGINEGKINRCNPTGQLVVEAAAADAACGGVVGINRGSLSNVIATVDVSYTAAGAAKVSALVGIAEGGVQEFLENHGKLTVSGENKTVGLFAGEATDTVFNKCVFGGEDNSLNGQIFNHFTGNPDDDELVVAVNALWRDNNRQPLTEAQKKLRDRVVEEMYKICTVEWKVRQDLTHTCYCTLSSCHGAYNSNHTIYGIPYNHKGGSLDRFLYCFDEEGYAKDWVYEMDTFDGYDAYIGNDCSTSILHAYWTVSNSVDFMRVRYELPQYYDIGGCVAVGGYKHDFDLRSNEWTDIFYEQNTLQEIYEAFACARPGDIIASMREDGGHTRMVAQDPVVIRDQNGLINDTYSCLRTHEQGMPWTDDATMTASSCRTDWRYSFGALANQYYIPVTCEELLTGEMEPVECTLTEDADGILGLTTGYIKANYFLDSVTLKITDSQGNVVMDQKMFTTAARRAETGDNDQIMRNYKDDYDMAYFGTPLQAVSFVKGETYSYTITARLGTYDEILLKEDSFTFGN